MYIRLDDKGYPFRDKGSLIVSRTYNPSPTSPKKIYIVALKLKSFQMITAEYDESLSMIQNQSQSDFKGNGVQFENIFLNK